MTNQTSAMKSNQQRVFPRFDIFRYLHINANGLIVDGFVGGCHNIKELASLYCRCSGHGTSSRRGLLKDMAAEAFRLDNSGFC
jgi:hypothetical protein